MGGMVLGGSLLIGASLIVGQQYFPGYIVMWFASAAREVIVWREAIVAGLVLMMMVRQYYHNLALQLLWGVAAVALLWASGVYFLNNPSYIFDTMLMATAGTAFAIQALQPAYEPIGIRAFARAVMSKRSLFRYAKLQSADRLASWRYMTDAKDVSHQLTIQHHVNRTASV